MNRLIFFLLLLLIAVPPFLFLAPLIRYMRNQGRLHKRSRFSITDLLSLLLLIQLPLAWIATSIQGTEIGWVNVVLMVLAVIVAVVVWLAGILTVNRIGIEHQLKRVVATGFVFPGAVASGVACLFVIATFMQIHEISTARPIALIVGLILFFAALRLTVLWLIPKNSVVEQM